MRKSLLLGASTAFAVILTACGGNGSVEQVEAVYGPPPAELHEHDDPVEDVYGAPVEPWTGDPKENANGEQDTDADADEDGDSGEKGYNASMEEDSDGLIAHATLYGVPVGSWVRRIIGHE